MIPRITSFVPILSAVIFAALCLLFKAFVADDAFIVGRYALNAVEGQGLVFNAGEYVTALTSPLHALLETVIAMFHKDPVLIYRLIAPLFPLAGIFIAARIVDLKTPNRALFFVFALTSPFLALWTVGGLETPILTGLIAIYAALIVRIAQHDVTPTEFMALGIVAGLAFVTRYDSLIVLLPPLLALAVTYWKRPSLWVGGAIALAIAGAWLGFSFAYYGDVVPTSAYVKLGEHRNPQIYNIYATLNFLIVTGLVLLLPLAGICSPQAGVGRALFLGALISALLFLAYALKASGQHMMFGNRMFVPYLPAIALILALSARRWVPYFTVAILALNLGFAGVMFTQGINPSPVTRIPGLSRADPELSRVTPAEYGHFIDVLRQDAVHLQAHWAATERTETPSIFLYTGGTGYWLRDFHIFELLINYRHTCENRDADMMAAANYVQDFGIVPLNSVMMAHFMDRADATVPVEFVSDTRLKFDRDTYIRYAYGPTPGNFRFPANVNAPCD